jgi:hypothetical protein
MIHFSFSKSFIKSTAGDALKQVVLKLFSGIKIGGHHLLTSARCNSASREEHCSDANQQRETPIMVWYKLW